MANVQPWTLELIELKVNCLGTSWLLRLDVSYVFMGRGWRGEGWGVRSEGVSGEEWMGEGETTPPYATESP